MRLIPSKTNRFNLSRPHSAQRRLRIVDVVREGCVRGRELDWALSRTACAPLTSYAEQPPQQPRLRALPIGCAESPGKALWGRWLGKRLQAVAGRAAHRSTVRSSPALDLVNVLTDLFLWSLLVAYWFVNIVIMVDNWPWTSYIDIKLLGLQWLMMVWKTPGSISLPALSAFGAQVHVWGCIRKREKYLIANVQLLFRSGTLYGKCGAKEIWSADQLKFWTQKGGRVWTTCGLQHELRVCFQKDSTGDAGNAHSWCKTPANE